MNIPDPAAGRPDENDESSQQPEDDSGTFETDVSETDDEGTTVREAEVREDDLSETGKPNRDSE